MAGATRAESLNILRTLYRELRPTVNAPQKHVYETQLWKHIVGLCRSCKSYPTAKIPEAQRNLEETGRSYVFYLQGSKEYHRICDEYKGHGERSAKDTATMLGFRMPFEPKDPPKQKSTIQSKASSTETSSSNNVTASSSSSPEFNIRTELTS